MPKTYGLGSPLLSGPQWKPCARCSRIAFPMGNAAAMTHHTEPPRLPPLSTDKPPLPPLLPAHTCSPPFPRLFPMRAGKPGRHPLRRTAPSLLLMDAGKPLLHLPAPTGKALAWPPHQSKVLGREREAWGERDNPSSEGFSSPGSLPAYLLASGLASAFGAALSSAFGAAVMGSSLTGAKVTLVLSISAITSLVTSDLGSNASRLSAFIMTE